MKMPPANSANAIGAIPRETIALARRGTFGAKAVGSFLPALTAKAFRKFGFSASALVTDWQAIVGREFAAVTTPERLSWPRIAGKAEEPTGVSAGRSGATLVLRVDGARALEVQYASRQIIERVNTHFGYAAVAQLRLVQAPRPTTHAPPAPRRQAPPVARDVTGVRDPALRAALARLAGQVHAAR